MTLPRTAALVLLLMIALTVAIVGVATGNAELVIEAAGRRPG